MIQSNFESMNIFYLRTLKTNMEQGDLFNLFIYNVLHK